MNQTIWTDPVLTALLTKIKSAHISELRAAVNNLETAAVNKSGDSMTGVLGFTNTDVAARRVDNSLSLDAKIQYGILNGKSGAFLCTNCYWDGINWLRYDVSAAAYIIDVSSNNGIRLRYAASGDNPISDFTMYKIWHEGNDGTGSSLDADMVDGKHAPSGSIVGTTDAQTLTSKTLTSPKVGTSILDVNGNEVFVLTATASAVNEVTVVNAAVGSGPTIRSSGNDTNIDFNIAAKGTGSVKIDGNKAWHRGNLSVGTTAPSNPAVGDLWVDTN